MKIENKTWEELRSVTPEKMAIALSVLEEIRQGRKIMDAIRRYPLPDGGYVAKQMLVAAYRQMVEEGKWQEDDAFLARIRMKPVRTLSGVTTVTVLTKPYPCPGKCIFCPTDIRMPKSYLPDEPGARRAVQHNFDPYDQVASRIEALEAVGHPTEKIELLILGGTWNSYKRDYQQWFVQRCLDAMNKVDSQSLQEAQRINETASQRNVGMVIETRPDRVTPDELAWIRSLGVTKVQMGAQSLDDRILALNQRGHTVHQTLQAMHLLRAAGFKVVLHWMPNLFGATPDSDREDFVRLWEGFCPDEIKIYPNQLLENAELYQYWLRGEFTPYTTEELIHLIADVKETIPRYCRVNRIIRDIPSTNVVEGNKRTSLRQDVHAELARRGTACQCIRCREVRSQKVSPEYLHLNDLIYETGVSQEHFISFDTPQDHLAGFLRLSLPGQGAPDVNLPDLAGAAIIREVHVYGQSLPVGTEELGAAQHSGLGTRLIQHAEKVASSQGFKKLAVISAIGTRQYYLKQGFCNGTQYQIKDIVG